ncbi:FGGY family carbohydrate kinase [Streptomyces cheonanensis]|uniref:FGGY family carbohydrate kinase n=1 Tax=Streptomyces cheonanensis TaxID=312720 RepID=A0ABN2US54_9ACTN
MGIVAGLDSSSVYTRIVVCDADTGQVVRHGHADHPAAEATPEAWLLSLGDAAGGGVLEDVSAIGVAAQAHAVVALDETGAPVRAASPPVGAEDRGRAAALDTAARELVDALGGPDAWSRAVGSVPQGGAPVARLRRLARENPEAARRVAGVALAQDWLVWQLLGRPARMATDRGGASSTGYWSPLGGAWRPELVELALGHAVALPEVLAPAQPAGRTPEGQLISAGTGETMAAAFGLGVGPGDAVISLGASGSVCAVHGAALPPDATGSVTAYADATGHHLPVVRTLNAVRVLRGTAELLGCDLPALSDLALRSTPGAHGLVFLPYLAGERVPALPHAAGTLTGLRRESMKPEHLARAAFEGMLCGLADAADVLRRSGVRIDRVFLLGAAADLPAVRDLAPSLLGASVVIPAPATYTAQGAARQAAWSLGVDQGTLSPDTPPKWPEPAGETYHPTDEALATGTGIRHQFAAVRDSTHGEG